MATTTALLAVWLAAAAPTAADATAPTHALAESVSVAAGTACLEQARLVEGIAQWLGYSAIDARLHVEVRAGVDTVTIVVFEGDTVSIERRIAPMPADCADLHAAVGLAIALAIDASVLETLGVPPPAPPSSPVDERDEDAPPLEPPAPPPEPPAPPKQPLHFGLVASAVALVGAPTQAAFGGALVGELGPAPWIDLDLGIVAAGGLRVDIAGGSTLPVLVAGQVSACPGRAFAGKVRLRVCVGLDAGAFSAQGHGFAEPQQALLPWIAARTGVDVDVRLATRASLRIGLGVLAPIVHTALVVYDSSGEIAERKDSANVGGLFTLGVVVHGRSRW